MPIKKLAQQTAHFPIIGKLRKGDKKTNEKQMGKDLDYFRFDTDDTDAMYKFTFAYGEQPKAITVYLPFRTIEENFTCWQEEYSASGLKHRCDGETCVIWQDEKGKYQHTPKPCPGGCKAVGRLTIIIPELMRFAYVSVETHSVNDIMQLQRNLNAAFALRGNLTGIPFLLIRRQVEISTPSGADGKRVRRTKSLLFLEPHPDWVQVKLMEMRQNMALETTTHKQLTDGRTVDVDTGEVIEYIDEDDEEITVGNPFHDNESGATSPADKLTAKISVMFGRNAAPATAWLIRGYTKKHTPNNIRQDISALTPGECTILLTGLSNNADDTKASFAQYLERQSQPSGK